MDWDRRRALQEILTVFTMDELDLIPDPKFEAMMWSVMHMGEIPWIHLTQLGMFGNEPWKQKWFIDDDAFGYHQVGDLVQVWV